jgi:16S rRNA (guanine527-N7)-methyltransferase
MNFLPTLVSELAAACGTPLGPDQVEKLKVYLELLRKWSQNINLTSIQDADALLRFHFFEAFWAAEHFLEETVSVADIGSGAGFPGLAMKIYRPGLGLTLLESNTKKALFLETVCRKAGLEAAVRAGRAEAFQGWEKIDIATIRALKPSPQILSCLRRNLTRLLIFRGHRAETLEGWELIREERYPLSENRWASLWSPL